MASVCVRVIRVTAARYEGRCGGGERGSQRQTGRP